MLDILLLKMKHETEEDAKTLLPYVGQCDIMGVEHTCATEQEALEAEKIWRDLMVLSSRSLFHRTLEVMVQKQRKNKDAYVEYQKKMSDYLYRAQKPIVVMERFAETEVAFVRGLQESSDLMYEKALNQLIRGQLKEGIVSVISYGITTAMGVRLRDENIARNLDSIEPYIREQNPSLRGRDTIRLTIELGGGHMLEKRSRLPIRVIDLGGGKPGQDEFIPFSEKAGDYSPRDALAQGVAGLLKEANLPVDQNKLRSAPLDELMGILRTNQSIIRERIRSRR